MSISVCYAIVDPEVAGGHDLVGLCRMLAAGGVTLVQFRDKLSDTRVMVERARAIKAALGRRAARHQRPR